MTEETVPRLRDDIATKIMGWETVTIPWAYTDEARCWQTPDGTPILPTKAWRPDEDELQCMQVLERMLELGYTLHLEVSQAETAASFTSNNGSGEARANERRSALLLAACAALCQ